MADSKSDTSPGFLKKSPLYRQFLDEREQILKLQAEESEKAGYDIGWEKALLTWMQDYRSTWLAARKPKPPESWWRRLIS